MKVKIFAGEDDYKLAKGITDWLAESSLIRVAHVLQSESETRLTITVCSTRRQ